jgi:hypothetical protein
MQMILMLMNKWRDLGNNWQVKEARDERREAREILI